MRGGSIEDSLIFLHEGARGECDIDELIEKCAMFGMYDSLCIGRYLWVNLVLLLLAYSTILGCARSCRAEGLSVRSCSKSIYSYYYCLWLFHRLILNNY